MAEYKDIDENERDPVDYIIIISGIIVGLLILYGFIRALITVFSWNVQVPESKPQPIIIIDSSPDTQTQPINVIESPGPTSVDGGIEGYHLSLRDNAIRQTIAVPNIFTLELSSALYPQSGLSVVGNPDGALEIVGPTDPVQSGDWAIIIKAVSKGVGDIIVPAGNKRYSDFHVSFTIK